MITSMMLVLLAGALAIGLLFLYRSWNVGKIRSFRRWCVEFRRSIVDPSTGNVAERMPSFYSGIVALLYVAVLVVGLSLALFDVLNLGWYWLVGVIAFELTYTIFSFKTVDTEEIAVKTFFRKGIQNVSSGLTFVPLGICDLILLPKTQLDLYVGRELDKDGNPIQVTPRPGIYASNAPFRVTFASSDTASYTLIDPVTGEEYENDETRRFRVDELVGATDEKQDKRRQASAKEDPLNHRLTTDPRVALWGRIENPRRFVNAVGKVEDGYRKVEQVVVSTLVEYCAKRTPAFVNHFVDNAMKNVHRRVEELIGDPQVVREMPDRDRWGFNLIGSRITSFGLSHSINKAMVDARAASYEKRKNVELARAEAEKERLKQLAFAEGRKAQALALDSHTGRFIIASETAAKMAENANLTMVPTDNPFGWLVGAKQALEARVREVPKDTPPSGEQNDEQKGTKQKPNKGKGQK